MRKPGIIPGRGEARAFGDTYALKRDLRARIMRKLGVEVDRAPDISQARALQPADSYSLVLVDVRNDLTH